jgi:hypothetical protein
MMGLNNQAVAATPAIVTHVVLLRFRSDFIFRVMGKQKAHLLTGLATTRVPERHKAEH